MKFLAIAAALSLTSQPLFADSIKLPHLNAFEGKILAKSTIIYSTEEGHHFNEGSPLNCGSSEDSEAKILKKEPTRMSCSYPKAGNYRPFLAVCDNGKKFCKIFRPNIEVTNKGTTKKTKVASLKFPQNAKEEKTLQMHHGFLLGNPQELINANLKSDPNKNPPKAMLLDFFALWCPPCNDLDELVFSSPAFSIETASLMKIKINVDEDESWDLKEKYKILAYPTLIYLNAKGEEVGRFNGTQSPETFINWIQKMKTQDSMPINWAAQQADAENVKRIIVWSFDTEDYEKVKSLAGSRSESWAKEYLLRAEYKLAVEKKDTRTQKKKLEALLEKFPDNALYGFWLLNLSSLDKDDAKEKLPAALKNISSWLAKPQAMIAENLSEQDLVILKADLIETLGSKEELNKAQSEAIRVIEKSLDNGKTISRGRSPVLAYYYREQGRFTDAKKLYEAMVKGNPKEFTFYYRYANALKSLKENDNALKWLEQGALYMTDGNSKIQYATLKGEILNDLGRKDEALQIVDGTLSIAKASKWKRDRSVYLLKDLEAVKEKIIKKDTPKN